MTTAKPPGPRRAGPRQGRPGARAAAPLSLDAIVDVALRIVDEEGTEAVSMRRVAAEFDTGPASLYAYVANKDELLRLVLDRIIDEIAVRRPGDLAGAWCATSRSTPATVFAAAQRRRPASASRTSRPAADARRRASACCGR